MTHSENLLIIAAEECAEIQQEIAKALRFGLQNHHPEKPELTNEKRIMQEFEQLCAVMDMLAEEGIIHPLSDEERDAVHKEKVRAVKSWELYSKRIGVVEAV